MKKIRFIPLLAVLALTSCGTMNPPSFEDAGEEVSYSEYKSKLDLAMAQNEIFDNSGILDDRTTKIEVSISNVTSARRNGSEIEKREQHNEYSIEQQCDYDNYVAKRNSSEKNSVKTKTQTYSETTENSSEGKDYIQFGKVNSVEYLLQIDTITKEYYSINVATSKEAAFDQEVRQLFSNYLQLFNIYAPQEYEVDDYLFYINEDLIFTFMTTTEKVEDLHDEKLGRDYVYATETSRRKIKGQINLTDKKEAVRVNSTVTTETVYKEDDEYRKGDIVTDEYRTYLEFTSSAKEVNLDVIDIVDYHHAQ